MHSWCRSLILVVLGCSLSALAQVSSSSLADIKTAAEAGDPAAQTKLADRFGMRSDSESADTWYRKAAAQGFAPAQGKLAGRLLMRYRIPGARSASECAAIGAEALYWATHAAAQGHQEGQAALASIYLEGKLTKLDLVQAYKWGDLAAQGSGLDTAAISGRSTRDSATLKMTPAQITEAKQLVAAFKPAQLPQGELPDPAWVREIRLTGLSGPATRRLALINGTTFSQGETATLKLAGKGVKVRCVEIRATSVLVELEGLSSPRELSISTAP